jgi:hypothetical protein
MTTAGEKGASARATVTRGPGRGMRAGGGRGCGVDRAGAREYGGAGDEWKWLRNFTHN